ncbi:helix-turn-helix domain-containing protein [Nocardia sp. NBC_00565]|uniref:helix-turn-helix domain-containing protein n=1 Tax=Nocardia sp. NBC_00565 TaxID=2975993 RepID=UPI002E801372|nr:helix-turn-helix domain-containing protein [Nocardia sp. NBC_00565]WUC01111.1 helix-turn-helix domain-containing protein [Nocardia sp. NBC_00565]
MDKPGSLLRLARESQGVSLSAVAAKTHFSKSMLGMLENDQRDVKPEHIVVLRARPVHLPERRESGQSGRGSRTYRPTALELELSDRERRSAG